ncbi:MAG TPA: glycosyltransferase family 4 protein [Candidatus Dormibacteraeota bacterium]|nr:glycosyltransferase family 4 protein [Candidatus Dormibacteraeota bacterium]
MKLSFLTDAVYPFHHGGKETLHYERSVRLARRGHAVRILTMHWWPERKRSIARDGIVFQSVAPRTALYTSKGGRSVLESVVFGLGSLRLLWSPPFDVLDVDQFPFTHFFAARLVCRLRDRPMTATWYEVWDRDYWGAYMGRLGPVGFFLQRFAARSADLIFADSRLTARRLTEQLGVDPHRVLVLSPGVDVGPVPSPLLAKAIDCIFIGRLLAHKHVDVLLRALAIVPGVTGMIVGSGPEKPRLITLANELGISDRVSFESPASHEAVIERLRSARLLVFPSTREGFGVAVLEANACGVPALVVQHPDNAALELVRDGVTGIIGDLAPEPMAEQIRNFLADALMQSRMSKAARATAATYSWDAYVNKMEAALMSLVGEIAEKAA